MNKIRLTKKFHKKFTEALRSGDYEQANGHLYESNSVTKHCCLGVAFEICDTINKDTTWRQYSLPSTMEENYINDIGYPYSLIDNESILAELNDGFVTDEILNRRAEEWNMIYDNNTLISQYSFSQIAEFIDNNLEIIK